MLLIASKATNRHISLAEDKKKYPRKHPNIKQAQQNLLDICRRHHMLSQADPPDHDALQQAEQDRSRARAQYKQEVRRCQQQQDDGRDLEFNTLLTTNPNKFL